MLRWIALLGLLASTLCLSAGCGPVTSTIRMNDAEVAVESARLEAAEEFATYEFVSAVEYLAKAKDEWGRSNYQHAEAYAARAISFAEAALERAMADPDRNLRGLDFEDEDEDL